jgi:hypothetical protein
VSVPNVLVLEWLLIAGLSFALIGLGVGYSQANTRANKQAKELNGIRGSLRHAEVGGGLLPRWLLQVQPTRAAVVGLF